MDHANAVYIGAIPRIQPSFSREAFALIQKHAEEAGMSTAAYVRDAACRSAGWDEAMNQLRARIEASEEREAARERRLAALEREFAAVKRRWAS